MERVAVSELTMLRWPFEEDAAWIQRLGFGAIGVWREKLADFGEEKGAELLTEAGLAVSSLQWAGGFTGSEGMTFAESLDDAIEAIDTAALLQAHCLIVHSGSQAGHTRSHAHRLLRTALKTLVPYAREAGVRLALEPMRLGVGRDWTLLSSLRQCSDLINDLGTTQVGIVFDTYHLGTQPNIVDQIHEYIGQICLVQVADQRQEPTDEQNRCLIGEGRLGIPEILGAFEANQFSGYYEIELLGEELEPLSYPEVLTHSKDAFAHCYSGIRARQTR